MQVAERLGVQLPQEEVLALFTRHGYTTFIMPVAALHDLILPSAAVKATADAPAKRRPFTSGTDATGAAPAFACKLTYRPCKTPVFTPSRWPDVAHEAIERSSRVPDARLRLNFVYGYAGFNTTSCNLFYNCNREVLPSASALRGCREIPRVLSAGAMVPHRAASSSCTSCPRSTMLRL